MNLNRWTFATGFVVVLLVAACSQDVVVVGPDSNSTSSDTGVVGNGNQTADSAPLEPSAVDDTSTTTTLPGESDSPSPGGSNESDDVRSGERGESDDAPGEVVPEEEAVTPLMGEVPEALLAPVLADAAERLGTTELDVIRSEFVEWPDGSLGCPQPGMMYTQAITPGYWIEIEAGDVILDYRMNQSGFFTLCESGDTAAAATPREPIVPVDDSRIPPGPGGGEDEGGEGTGGSPNA